MPLRRITGRLRRNISRSQQDLGFVKFVHFIEIKHRQPLRLAARSV